MRVATIGVYGFDADRFRAALQRTGVGLVVDVRERRGVRGSEYAWANSQRLQAMLADAGVDGALTGLSDDPLPPGVEVTRRGDHWFLLNHTDHDVRLGLTAPVRDLLTTTHHTHHLDLRAGDVVVLDKE